MGIDKNDPGVRRCVRCRSSFWSEHCGNRMCAKCLQLARTLGEELLGCDDLEPFTGRLLQAKLREMDKRAEPMAAPCDKSRDGTRGRPKGRAPDPVLDDLELLDDSAAYIEASM